MEWGIIIKNGVIIAVLLTIVFLSQQPQFKTMAESFYQKNMQHSSYWVKAQDWIKANVWSKFSGGVSTVKDSATKEITKQKNNAAQNIWEQFKTSAAQKFSNIFGTKVK